MLIIARSRVRCPRAVIRSGGLIQGRKQLLWAVVLVWGVSYGVHGAERSALDAQQPVPAVRYKSVFEGFGRLQDSEPGDWRAANETVGRIGGWRVYSRETEPAGAPAAPPSPAGAHHHHPPQGKPAVRQP